MPCEICKALKEEREERLRLENNTVIVTILFLMTFLAGMGIGYISATNGGF